MGEWDGRKGQATVYVYSRPGCNFSGDCPMRARPDRYSTCGSVPTSSALIAAHCHRAGATHWQAQQAQAQQQARPAVSPQLKNYGQMFLAGSTLGALLLTEVYNCPDISMNTIDWQALFDISESLSPRDI